MSRYCIRFCVVCCLALPAMAANAQWERPCVDGPVYVNSLAVSGAYLFTGNADAGGAWISRSGDGGKTWTTADIGLGASYVHALAVTNDAVFAGTANYSRQMLLLK